MLRFASGFGFTPAARSRIAAGVGGQTSSKFGDLLLLTAAFCRPKCLVPAFAGAG
jgi:hypothetical protein